MRVRVRVRVRVRGACLRMSTINITPIRAKAAGVELVFVTAILLENRERPPGRQSSLVVSGPLVLDRHQGSKLTRWT